MEDFDDNEVFFKNRSFDITFGLNDEQIIDFVLDYLCTKEGKTHDVAEKILANYVIKGFPDGQKFSLAEVNAKCRDLILNKSLENLSKKGLIEVNFGEDGEIVYKLTEDGKALSKKMGL